MEPGYVIILCLILILMVAMLVAIALMKNARRLKVKHEKVDHGPSFALISDIHIGILPVDVRDIIECVKDSGAEFLLITGDLCNKIEETGLACSFVGLLAEGLNIPIFIVLGNHDEKIFRKNNIGRQAFIAGLEDCGRNVHVLDNCSTRVGDMLICGLHDNATNNDNIDELIQTWGAQSDEQKLDLLLMTHNADVYLKMKNDASKRPIIAVSGHTHGGQINLPFNIEFALLKRDILPKKNIYYGRHEFKGMPIYITSGIGCSTLPMRLGSNPEVVIFNGKNI